MKNDTIVIGTRSSKLALWQADYVADCLRKRYPELRVEKKLMTTKGDKILDAPLAKIGGKGLFTKELEQDMIAGGIDIAVHSLKDMPTEVPEGLVISAITERFDPGDAVVSPKYRTLENLPQGAKVGTSSLRRKAQLLHARPDLQISDLRGNVNTRLEKLEREHFDAIILAVAGLKRLGFADRITLIPGDAAEVLKTLDGPYDFIFMDAAKGQYIHFLPEVLRVLDKNGVLITDNVLQDGDVIESRFAVERRNRTIHKRMREYLFELTHNEGLLTSVVPLGDGIAITMKSHEKREETT
mgnify:CR=1 FL=1